MSHSLLVYGYDKRKKEFIVMEYENMNSLIYKAKVLSYEAIAKAYEGYIEDFHRSTMLPTFYEFSASYGIVSGNSMESEHYGEVFIKNVRNIRGELHRSLEALISVRDDFVKLISYDELPFELNEILKGRYMEKYKHSHLMPERWEFSVKTWKT